MNYIGDNCAIDKDCKNNNCINNKCTRKRSKSKKLYSMKNRVRFVPEIDPVLIKYDKKYWNSVFKTRKNVDKKKLQLSNIGAYSIVKPNIANSMAKILYKYVSNIKNPVITDATSNMGGMTIAFAKYFYKINAVEVVPLHCKILENNLKVHKLYDKINIICDNYIDVYDKINQDIIFFDPPWGGKDYKNKNLIHLKLDNLNMHNIFQEIINSNICKYVAITLPHNYDFSKLFAITNKYDIYTFVNKKTDTVKSILFVVEV